VWQNEIFTKALQHPFTIVLLPKFDCSKSNQASDVPTKTLRRRIIEAIRDIRDRKSGILE
jgi:hypothetical protein